tara:strand:+ start:389 stop:811 length:423 start_codon:yes stop_codon:yes gene_type:complete
MIERQFINEAKVEIEDKYTSLDVFPDDFADLICSIYYYKYQLMTGPENIYEKLADNLLINRLANNTLPDMIPDFKKAYIECMRDYISGNMEFKFSCEGMKLILQYGFSPRTPLGIMKIKSKFKKPQINIIDGLAKKMGVV